MLSLRLPSPNKGTLIICGFNNYIDCIRETYSEPFLVMLPAFSRQERIASEGIAINLVDLGCIDFCCVGQQAEQLHDAIDYIIEDKNNLSVLTTWHCDIKEGCEYFIFAAGIGVRFRIAIVSKHNSIISCLQQIAAYD